LADAQVADKVLPSPLYSASTPFASWSAQPIFIRFRFFVIASSSICPTASALSALSFILKFLLSTLDPPPFNLSSGVPLLRL
jgi:hypothetical protein